MLGAMREMAEVALTLGNAGVRLVFGPHIVGMTIVAELGDGLDQKFGIGPGMGNVAIQTVAVAEGFVLVGNGRIGIGHLLPVALPADFGCRSP